MVSRNLSNISDKTLQYGLLLMSSKQSVSSFSNARLCKVFLGWTIAGIANAVLCHNSLYGEWNRLDFSSWEFLCFHCFIPIQDKSEIFHCWCRANIVERLLPRLTRLSRVLALETGLRGEQDLPIFWPARKSKHAPLVRISFIMLHGRDQEILVGESLLMKFVIN